MDNKFIFYAKNNHNTGYSSFFNTLLSFSNDIGCVPVSVKNIGKKVSTIQDVVLPDNLIENFFNTETEEFVDTFESSVSKKLDILNNTIKNSKYKHVLPFALPIRFAKQYKNYVYVDQSTQKHLDTYDRLIAERQVDFMRLNEETSMFFCNHILNKDILKFNDVIDFLDKEYHLSKDQVYDKSFDYITTLMKDPENGDEIYYKKIFNHPVVYNYEMEFDTRSEKLDRVIDLRWFFKSYTMSLSYYVQVCEKMEIEPNKELFTILYENFISKDIYDQLVILTGNATTARAIIDKVENDC